MIYINDNPTALKLEQALGEISAQRREQALKYKPELHRKLSVAAYLLLKEALLKEYGITENPVFGYEEGGKPFIEGHPEIYFNLSHCRLAAACVVSSVPVGIDVEAVRPFKDDLGRYVLSDEEYQHVVSSANRDEEFIRLWTMKESLLKMTGEGIRRELQPLLEECQTGTPDSPYFHTIVADGYVYTVCCKTKDREICLNGR